MLKSKIFLYSTIAVFSAVVLAGCVYDQILPAEPDPGVVYSFQNDIMPIFNAACNTPGCHIPGGPPPDLSPANAYNALFKGNYINLDKPDASELYQWMKGTRRLPMPLSGPNSEYNVKVLGWITQGAKNN